MKHIIAFLLTVALLSFSIVTGRAEQPTEQRTELPSGTYYFSITSKDQGEYKVSVRLTSKIREKASYFDDSDIVIEEILAKDQIPLFGKFEGRTVEIYSEGKMIDGNILLSMTKFMEGKGGGKDTSNITTWHLTGHISNHSAKGEGTIFSSHSKDHEFKWTLTNQPQG